MKKRLFVLVALSCFGYLSIYAQHPDSIINENEVLRIESVLAHNDMEGRAVFTPGIERAADFIAAEFKAAGLQPWRPDSSGYRQSFTVDARSRRFAGKALSNVVGILPGKSRKDEFVIFSGHYDHLGIGRAKRRFHL